MKPLYYIYQIAQSFDGFSYDTRNTNTSEMTGFKLRILNMYPLHTNLFEPSSEISDFLRKLPQFDLHP